MDNASLKAKIERSANVRLKTSFYKCDDFEGYVSAYSMDTETFVVKRKTCYRGKPIKSTVAYAGRTGAQAIRAALLLMAAELNVAVSDDDKTAVSRANQAEFDVRTKRFVGEPRCHVCNGKVQDNGTGLCAECVSEDQSSLDEN